MNLPVVKTLDITHLDSPRHYISTEKNILLMIEATDSFVEHGQKPAPLRFNASYRHTKALPDKVHVCLME